MIPNLLLGSCFGHPAYDRLIVELGFCREAQSLSHRLSADYLDRTMILAAVFMQVLRELAGEDRMQRALLDEDEAATKSLNKLKIEPFS